MAISSLIYNTFMKRNSVYVSTIFAGSFAFSLSFDTITTKWWEKHNRGKLWSDIRDKVVSE
ncbi:cytochrome b-c1 complex subunit 9 [Melampsora americana]|nr:cytochrome b-c1 complex subunit 9 [Melampsora americana]